MPRGTSKKELRAIRLQESHIEQLRTVGEVGLMDTDMFWERFFPHDRTGQGCRRRTRQYAAHGLFQKLRPPVVPMPCHGRVSDIFRLTDYAADVLEHETGQRPLRYARSDPPRMAHTILHRLGIAKLMLAFNDACTAKGLTKPEWILEYDPTPYAAVGHSMSRRFRLCHQFGEAEQKLTCWPDATSQLHIPHNGTSAGLGLFWEYDRSTESHAQLKGQKPSHPAYGKLDGYAALLHSQEYRAYWPDVKSSRILFVVRSEERFRNMAQTFGSHPVAKAVRFAVESEVTPEHVLTARIWRTIGGERRSIL